MKKIIRRRKEKKSGKKKKSSSIVNDDPIYRQVINENETPDVIHFFQIIIHVDL